MFQQLALAAALLMGVELAEWSATATNNQTGQTGYEGQPGHQSNGDGQQGYEGQPGNQGGGGSNNGNGLKGYEGQPGNQGG